jgi:cell division protein YceG involved in septum cleavage
MNERNNPYDTRTKMGLPWTPIANMTASTFLATLNAPAETSAWYYLHDNQGIIRTATTEAEHEQNKSQYLR